MKIIGLTGNTGSGKTHVCSILKDIGGLIIDADEISHNVILKGNQAYEETVQFFGEEILDAQEQIDRKKLGGIVFSDKKKLDYLSSIIHKYVIEESVNIITAEKEAGVYRFAVLDAPLLVESGMYKMTDCVWLVHADLQKRMKRIMERDNLTQAQAEMRIKSQTEFESLKPYATEIIYNNGSDEELNDKIIMLTKKLLGSIELPHAEKTKCSMY